MKEIKKSIVNETVGTLAAELEAQLNDTPFWAYRSTIISIADMTLIFALSIMQALCIT